MRPGLQYSIGDGQQFYVWLDIWHPRGPFDSQLSARTINTGLPSDSLLQCVIRQGRWNWPSAIDFDIQDIISDLPTIHFGQSDSITWISGDGRFTTAAAIAMLQPPSTRVPWR
ncbi:UNVERIFIED_CONTAM: hypothetical protein Sradi_6879800 [Sesamum radiatum]|uniref:Uncharacterized protein n=1 Tax=Sesamum radiatum TaxID=300843 RepID=A0AAW2JIQ2_SESRA